MAVVGKNVGGGGFLNEDGRLGMYVGETRGVHEVAGNPTDPPTPELMLRRSRMVLVHAHRPPCDLRQPWIGTAASLARGCKPCRGCTLEIWLSLPMVGESNWWW